MLYAICDDVKQEANKLKCIYLMFSVSCVCLQPGRYVPALTSYILLLSHVSFYCEVQGYLSSLRRKVRVLQLTLRVKTGSVEMCTKPTCRN